VELEFVNGVPTCINDVPMRIVELLESLTTIAAGHGIGSDELYAPAVSVLKAAYAAADASTFTGTVRLKLSGGTCAVVARMPLAQA
jgi:argininosuccinate synthase